MNHVLKKKLLLLYSNTKKADRPGYPPSLIGTFCIHFLESIIAIHDTFKFQGFN